LCFLTFATFIAADGLYVINSTEHSPLLGYAYDGFPIYGAYGYANADGTGGIARMKSGFQLRDIIARTAYADGTDVIDGPTVSATYPLGRYREDYEFVAHPGMEDYLDVHNGRFCVTPEYPNGTYAYFCTVDANHNSAYPYVVGPTFYGTITASKVASISEPVTRYTPSPAGLQAFSKALQVTVFPNPTQDFAAVQMLNLSTETVRVQLFDLQQRIVRQAFIYPGQTLCYLDLQTLQNGVYTLIAHTAEQSWNSKIIINRQ